MSVAEIARLIDLPVEAWPGNCYAVASSCVAAGVVRGELRYGQFVGRIAKTGKFAGRPFSHHAWVDLDDGRVWDATRWVFEDVAPYVYVGDGADYDFGGNRLREAFMRPAPRPVGRAAAVLKLRPRALGHVGRLLGVKKWRGRVTKEQLFWLASAPLHRLEPHAAAVYREIERRGRSALIPIDNRTAMDTRQDRLWCREGNSDKVYALALTQEHGGTWKVYAEWGRRGAKLQGATKYDGADLEAAQKVYDRLLKEKVGKGYEPLMAGPPDSGDEKVADEPAARAAPAVNVAAALPVVMRARLGQSAWLPSDAEPEEIPGLLADPAWWLQEKKDGIHLLTHRLPDRVVGTNRRGQVHPVPPEIDAALGTLPVGIVLDGEKVGVYEGAEVARYTYALYDCLQTGAHDLRGEGYAVRWEALVTIHAALAKISPAIDLVRNATSAEAKAVLMHQLEHVEVAEGVIFKHVDGRYSEGRLPRGGHLRRFKFRRRADAVIYRRGTDAKNSLDIFLFDAAGKQQYAGTAPGSTGGHKWLQDLAVGEARVAELSYQYASHELVFLGPQILAWRDDKDAAECIQGQLVVGKRYRAA